MTETPLNLIPDFDLTTRNTLALGARSRLGAIVTDAAMLPPLLQAGAPLRILGGGSNVVLAPLFDGITALVAMTGKCLLERTDRGTLIEVAAGESWHGLVTWTVEQGLGGLENLALIPGTVGAAPVQNIGAYGVEVAETLESVLVLDRQTLEERTFLQSECRFAYRDSLFKHDPDRFIVMSLRLRLPSQWVPNLGFAGLSDIEGPLTPRAVMDRVVALRMSKLPDWRVTPNAGSFFQNPIVSPQAAQALLAEFPAAPAFAQPDGRLKLSAGWLIEKSGLKGFRLGPVGMSERHALVLVNHGGAVQADVQALASHVRLTVQDRFGVPLHEEPVFC